MVTIWQSRESTYPREGGLFISMGCPLPTHPYNSQSGHCSDKQDSNDDVGQKVQYIAYKVYPDEGDRYLFLSVYFPLLREPVSVTLGLQKITTIR